MLNRRQFLTLAGAATLPVAAAAKKPNVLFIATDDLDATLGWQSAKCAESLELANSFTATASAQNVTDSRNGLKAMKARSCTTIKKIQMIEESGQE